MMLKTEILVMSPWGKDKVRTNEVKDFLSSPPHMDLIHRLPDLRFPSPYVLFAFFGYFPPLECCTSLF